MYIAVRSRKQNHGVATGTPRAWSGEAMLIYVVVITVGLAMIVVERAAPGRIFPRVRTWWIRALALNAAQAALLFATGKAWDGAILAHRLWQADALGIVGGAIVGYVVHTFVYYWWHRARHEVPLLWRFVHQVHHSPQRIEIITAFYKSPIEIVINSLLSSAVLYVVVGLNAQQALAAMIVNGLAELFYHWNVKTPRWLGYIIQRPESHCVHHQARRHRSNYSDLPIFDICFGTFENPATFDHTCGFDDEREQRLPEMLRGVDVHRARR